MNSKSFTLFAPAKRSDRAEINHQSAQFQENGFNAQLLDAIPEIVMVLNGNRQVVYANKALCAALKIEKETAYGFRPGELLDCIHAFDYVAGCGTTDFCSQCGAVNAILTSQAGQNDVRECRITRRSGESLDLRVWASPLEIDKEHFTIFTIKDISDEKRRQVLEKIFFHDVLNTTCSLLFTAYEVRGSGQVEDEIIERIISITESLNEEITAQRTLENAENGDLIVQILPAGSLEIVRDIARRYTDAELTKNRTLVISPAASDISLYTDRVLLKRVIGNMVKNALEACSKGDVVTIGCTPAGEKIDFWVNNPGIMPREVKLQIFQRSFSTKGVGRGLGTYSIKLLTERYLKGTASFTTSSEEGTTFTISIPAILG